jgi:D-alanyl-D-alanine carboxypeptidase (penicillin-binding protein 5/6)
MIFSRRVFAFLLLVALLPTAARSQGAAADYKSALVIEAATGRVLFEDNADFVNPPASITKLMTFLVVHDRIQAGALSLQSPVPVSAASSKIGGTQVWLKQGESFPVEEMLYALMVQSANDCAHALAVAVAGSPAAFVDLMNARARELGLTQTIFRTPHGLPPANRVVAEGDLTTARDLAKLSRHLLQHTDILQYTNVKERLFRAGAPSGEIAMRNHNHLLNRVDGVDGLKTGYTRGAGFCLAATAERHGRRVIAVIMGSPSSKGRDLKVAELIERGFASLPPPESPLTVAPLDQAAPVIAPAPETEDTPPPVIKFSIPSR